MKLVPASCPNCGAGVRIDPGAETVTCEFCHTTSFVESPHRKPPKHAKQVIHAQPQKRSAFGLIAILLVVSVSMAVVGVMIASTMAGAVYSASAPAAPRFLEGDAVRVPELFAPHFGTDIQVQSLGLYPAHAVLVGGVPDGIDEQFHVNGALLDPKPHRADDALFPLASIALDRVPEITADAVKRAGLTGGMAEYVRVARHSDDPPMMRVYVKNERDSVYVTYDTSGAFQK